MDPARRARGLPADETALDGRDHASSDAGVGVGASSIEPNVTGHPRYRQHGSCRAYVEAGSRRTGFGGAGAAWDAEPVLDGHALCWRARSAGVRRAWIGRCTGRGAGRPGRLLRRRRCQYSTRRAAGPSRLRWNCSRKGVHCVK